MIPLIPPPDTIPTSWGYFQVLLLLTFPLHLIFMNALIGSSAVALFSHFKGGDRNRRLAHELARVIPLLVAMTVNLGVAPLLFVQVLYGHLFYTSSILMGAFWIMIVPLLLLAYYATYWYDFRFSVLGRGGILLILFAWLGFLLIGFILSNNMTLMLHPESWSAYLDNSGGTLLNTADPAFWPRYLHSMLGGTAIGGLFVALYGHFLGRQNSAIGELAKAIGLKLFIFLTLLQIGIGSWFLLRLPRAERLLFMGQNGLATAIFSVALVLTLAVILSAWHRRLFITAGMSVMLIYLMVFMRDFLRTGYLKGWFAVESLTVRPDPSPLLLFLVTLTIGLGLVGWMLKAVWAKK